MVLRRSNSIVVRMRARAGTLYTRARHLYAQARGGSRVCTSHRVRVWNRGLDGGWRSSQQTIEIDARGRTQPLYRPIDWPTIDQRTIERLARGYSEPAVREPAESPDTAPIIASVRVGSWTVDDLNTYLAKHPNGS